jgi:hypothetical protein
MSGKINMLVTKTKNINSCYHECPYFELDGGPGPVMICGHPKAPDQGHIISHPECDDGFPSRCPIQAELAKIVIEVRK